MVTYAYNASAGEGWRQGQHCETEGSLGYKSRQGCITTQPDLISKSQAKQPPPRMYKIKTIVILKKCIRTYPEWELINMANKQG